MIAVVDTGPLYATVDARESQHHECLELFGRADFDFVIPALVITEVTYFIASRLGPDVEAQFLRAIGSFEIESPRPDEWPLIAALVEKYGDFPLGTVDASVAVLADRLGTDLILTLDRRHFGAIRSASGQPYRLLPG